MENSQVKNIIFDVGNVLVGYRWKDMLIEDFKVAPGQAEKIGMCAFNDPCWKLLDAGKISLEEVIEICSKKHPELADGIRLFFSDSVRMRVERPRVYEQIRRLKKKGYRLYILSNYSEKLLNIHTGDLEFWEDMDGELVSYQVGQLKPDGEIYQTILQKYDLKAEECLFFDDREENVEGAQKQGIRSIQVTGEDQLLEKLGEL